jgi:hypothetical protein
MLSGVAPTTGPPCLAPPMPSGMAAVRQEERGHGIVSRGGSSNHSGVIAVVRQPPLHCPLCGSGVWTAGGDRVESLLFRIELCLLWWAAQILWIDPKLVVCSNLDT